MPVIPSVIHLSRGAHNDREQTPLLDARNRHLWWHIRWTESRQQTAISPFWQIAALAFLTTTLHLHMVMAG